MSTADAGDDFVSLRRTPHRSAGIVDGGCSPEALTPLTPGERTVLALLADGLTYKEIAERRDREVQTIKNQVADILRKLHARNSTHAVVIGFRTGILHLGPFEVAQSIHVAKLVRFVREWAHEGA